MVRDLVGNDVSHFYIKVTLFSVLSTQIPLVHGSYPEY